MSLLEKLFKSRKIILEMIKSRGYNTEPFNNYSLNEIELMFSNHPKNNKEISPLDILTSNNDDNKIQVKYILTPKIRISNIQTLIDTIIENLQKNDSLILITRDKITSDLALEEILNKIYKEKQIFIQYFYIDTLTFSVIEHEFIPEHYILSDEEKTTFIENLNITSLDKLPKIKKTDPVAKYHGMKLNDICRISRKSETSGIYYYYRLCE